MMVVTVDRAMLELGRNHMIRLFGLKESPSDCSQTITRTQMHGSKLKRRRLPVSNKNFRAELIRIRNKRSSLTRPVLRRNQLVSLCELPEGVNGA
jgi:hypothetical protein